MSADPTLRWDEQEGTLRRRLEKLTPRGEPGRGPGEQPRAILIGGQQAAGKTTTQKLVHRALGKEGVASYDGDDNATAHPRYEAIMRANGIHGQAIVQHNLPSRLHFACLQHLRTGEPKYDVVASHPLQREDWAKGWVDGFRDNGYRVSAVYIATNESNSLLGIANRYQQDRDDRGYGRWVDPAWHDESYTGVPQTAHALESQGYVDDIYVVNRDGHTCCTRTTATPMARCSARRAPRRRSSTSVTARPPPRSETGSSGSPTTWFNIATRCFRRSNPTCERRWTRRYDASSRDPRLARTPASSHPTTGSTTG